MEAQLVEEDLEAAGLGAEAMVGVAMAVVGSVALQEWGRVPAVQMQAPAAAGRAGAVMVEEGMGAGAWAVVGLVVVAMVAAVMVVEASVKVVMVAAAVGVVATAAHLGAWGATEAPEVG